MKLPTILHVDIQPAFEYFLNHLGRLLVHNELVYNLY